MDSVLSADRNATHRILSQIVAQFRFRVLEKDLQSRPLSERVTHRLPQLAGRQRLPLRSLHSFLDRAEQFGRVLGAQLMACRQITSVLSRRPSRSSMRSVIVLATVSPSANSWASNRPRRACAQRATWSIFGLSTFLQRQFTDESRELEGGTVEHIANVKWQPTFLLPQHAAELHFVAPRCPLLAPEPEARIRRPDGLFSIVPFDAHTGAVGDVPEVAGG